MLRQRWQCFPAQRERERKQALVNIIRMMLDEVQKGKKVQPHGKLWCEKESGVYLSESRGCWGDSCWVSMICQWVSRAICWLSQTAGDYNYPGAGGGDGPACDRPPSQPLLPHPPARTWPAASRQPRSCTSTTLFRAEAFKCVHTRSVARL